MKRILTLIIITIVFIHNVLTQQIGSWGDQGNGIYKNPVLDANYPDNDVIRQGNTFFMMTSTNHFTPGMMIMKSNDLVNWQFSNVIMPAPITFDSVFDYKSGMNVDSRATWAGSFGFNGEYYFAYWCFNKKISKKSSSYYILFSKAKSMEGPWSEPNEITYLDGSTINCTDPGVLFDIEKKEAWMAIENGEIYKLSWSGDKLLQNKNEGITVTKTMRGEAAKLYKFDNWYYWMNAHWRKHEGVNQRMATFHRARSIEGPWEGRLAMENGNGTDRSPSQGTLLKLDDGSWWFIHQLARGESFNRYYGRPQILEPVTWKNGWPFFGVDTDGDSIGEVVWEHKKPITGFPIVAPATDDDFSQPTLGLQWYWRYNPIMERWSLTERKGYLRLNACVSLPEKDPERIRFTPNIIAQRVMGRYKNTATAKFDLKGMELGQEAGLHVSAIYNHVIGVKKDLSGTMQLFYKCDTTTKNPIEVVMGEKINQNDIWLQTKIENGQTTFYYSLDGKKFVRFGNNGILFFEGFTSSSIGFYSKNSEEKGFVDIDWFTYDYDGPKSKN